MCTQNANSFRPRNGIMYMMPEDIVISGVSGRFPESDTMDEFADNLFNKVDMITESDAKWPKDIFDVCNRMGQLKDVSKFDGEFFGLLGLQAEGTDPQARLLLEATYEAICDAGINPQSIRGSRTGVYIGHTTVGSFEGITQSDDNVIDIILNIQGNSLCFYPNRISYLFDFIGPSLYIDTGCSAALVAFEKAYNDMRNGICDMAVVGGVNLLLQPFATYNLMQLRVLSPDGTSRVWDKNANGYVRAEAVTCVFLQKKSESKRIYATVVHCKANIEGYKDSGMTFPSWKRQMDLMKETFTEAGINPADVKFIEAHGTGTTVGDPQEAMAIAGSYCAPELNRKDAVLLGALKSNMGHSEGASGLCGVAKVLVAFENKCIPPNLNYEECKPEAESIIKGILKPVTECTPFEGGIVGVNSFGIGAVNAHALLKSNDKELTEESYQIVDGIPRLVHICGRNEESVNYLYDFLVNDPKKLTRDFLALMSDLAKGAKIPGSSGMPQRMYVMIKDKFENENKAGYMFHKETARLEKEKPIWYIVPGMGSQWPGMAKALMPIEAFAKSLQKSADALKPYGVDLMNLVLSEDESCLENTIAPFVATTAIQVALIDVILHELQIIPDGIVGHSFGELACAYADGCLTKEEAVLCAYWRGKCVDDACNANILPRGMLAAIGLTWDDAKKKCPDGIIPCCHNAEDSVTISGPYEKMEKFVEQLKSEEIFVRRVKGCNVPYHSSYMNSVASTLLASLKDVIPDRRQRSSKWLSTSVPEEEWSEEHGKYVSAQYFVNNMISAVLFNEAMDHVPKDAIIIEIAPHSLFQPLIKRSLGIDISYVGLMKRHNNDNNLDHFLQSIGKLYLFGLNPVIDNLYPKVEWPVARGTQSISSLIKWNHSKPNFVKKYPLFYNKHTASDYHYHFSLKNPNQNYLGHHMIDGRKLFPATGYLMCAWKRFAAAKSQPWYKIPVHFENVKFLKPIFVSEMTNIKLTVTYLEASGEFSISENGSIACIGHVKALDTDEGPQIGKDIDQTNGLEEVDDFTMTREDIYKEFRLRGYDYGSKFQGLSELKGDYLNGKVEWTGNWISFADSILHAGGMFHYIRDLLVPIVIMSVKCDPKVLFDAINEAAKNSTQKVEDDKSTREVEDDKIGKTEETNEMNKRNETSETREMRNENENHCSEGNQDTNLDGGDKKVANTYEGSDETFRNTIDDIAKMRNALTTQYVQLNANDLIDPRVSEMNPSNVSLNATLPVKVDPDFWTFTTRGLEIRGLIPYTAPRRPNAKGLSLEKYEFVANDEENAIESRDKHELIEYMDICANLAEKILIKFGKGEQFKILNGFKPVNENIFTKYLNESKDNAKFALLQNLNKIMQEMQDDNNNTVNDDNNNTAKDDNSNKCKDSQSVDITKLLITSMTDSDILRNSFIRERLLRPSLDILLENCTKRKLSVLEMNETNVFMSTVINELVDVSTIVPTTINYTIAHPSPDEIPDETKPTSVTFLKWEVQETKLPENTPNDVDLIVYREKHPIESTTDEIRNYKLLLESMDVTVKEGGFILGLFATNMSSLEKVFHQLNGTFKNINYQQKMNKFEEEAKEQGFKIISRKFDSMYSGTILLRKIKEPPIAAKQTIIEIKTHQYKEWVELIKEKLIEYKEKPSNENIWLYANDTCINGIIGLTLCLRQEPGGDRIRCIYDTDGKLPKRIDFESMPYSKLLENDLTINVYRDGKLGTFRHIRLSKNALEIETENAYLGQTLRGDFSSLRWCEGPHKFWMNPFEEELAKKKGFDCNIYYSALNFRDLMIASGKLAPLPGTGSIDCLAGSEFSGIRKDNGKRIMGILPCKGFATWARVFRDDLIWEIPDHWSLAEAATVPVVYATTYYALIIRGNLRPGESVLIHSGAGGVGLAAINLCLSMGCTVYTTVGNDDKREFLKKQFPGKILDHHISNSRDLSFEKHVLKQTKGRGVDVVLNSLTEDKIMAGIRCLDVNGRFLEIGKSDMQNNKQIGTMLFLKNLQYQAIVPDCILEQGTNGYGLEQVTLLKKVMDEGIKNGVIKPLPRKIFSKENAEDAFRFMGTGKHVGKIIIQIRDDQNDVNKPVTEKPPMAKVLATPKTWFDPDKVYIIIGGLGGIGMEMAIWMAQRGATKLVLTSRSGVRNAHQRYLINLLRKMDFNLTSIRDRIELKEGINVTTSTRNVVQLEEAKKLIEESQQIGPIGGIFQLALVLNDGLIEDQTSETFEKVCNPKVEGLINLDKVTREMCPNLDYFVAFSSVTCGRGNSGQTNYGYANSVMERVCELRRSQGLHGLAIQWGPIGDAGIVADMLKGTDADKMMQFGGLAIQRINSLLAVLDRFLRSSDAVLSSIVKAPSLNEQGISEQDILQQLTDLMGIDPNTLAPSMTLGDIGIDSMLAVEIRNRLERDYDISMTLTEIRKITVGQLRQLRGGNLGALTGDQVKAALMSLDTVTTKFQTTNEPWTVLNNVKISATSPPILLLPTTEGTFEFTQWIKKLNRPVIGLNWVEKMKNMKSIKEVAKYYEKLLKEVAKSLDVDNNFDVIGLGFGIAPAAQILRKSNSTFRHLLLIDLKFAENIDINQTDDDLKYDLLFTMLTKQYPGNGIDKMKSQVMKIKDEKSRVKKLVQLLKRLGGEKVDEATLTNIIEGLLHRTHLLIKYMRKTNDKCTKISQNILAKKISKIKTDLIILQNEEKSIEEYETKLFNRMGLNKQIIDGKWDVEVLNGKTQKDLETEMIKIINSKLCI